jgi:hypothetical protein
VHHLALSSHLKFRVLEKEHLVAPEAQRLSGLKDLVVELSKQPVTWHKQQPPQPSDDKFVAALQAVSVNTRPQKGTVTMSAFDPTLPFGR